MEYYENQILTPDLLNIMPNHDRFEPNLNVEAINRCFAGGTLEEIFELLKRENTPWAKETLEILQSKSPLTLKVKINRENGKNNSIIKLIYLSNFYSRSLIKNFSIVLIFN